METFIPVLIASLIGSPHCAVMCGGFATACGTGRASNALLYHLGRALSYTFLGVLAGYAGNSLNHSLAFTGLSNFTALFIGCILLYWGIRQFLTPGYLSGTGKAPGFFTAVLGKIYSSAKSTAVSAFLLGIVSAFLPCAWLYSYVGVAASSGAPTVGALIMLAFWLGTVPILASLSSFSSIVQKTLGKHASRITALLFICAGIFSLCVHTGVIELSMHHHHSQSGTSNSANHSHHHHH